MEISKGLVIDEPWIGHILDGSKTWEMRSSSASHRGWFGLIRKGTGTVCGIANLVECGAPLTPGEMLTNRQNHQIPDAMIQSGEVSKWNTPWKLENIQKLSMPVPYRHKPGAVTWVLLDEEVNLAINAQLPRIFPAAEVSNRRPRDLPVSPKSEEFKLSSMKPASSVVQIVLSSGKDQLIGESILTDGNIKNNHIYLRPFVHEFPVDVVGGSNKTKKAAKEVTVDWGGSELTQTDIDGEKLFFRSRAWVSTFFKLNDARAGNRVQFLRVNPYEYRVRLVK